MNKKDVIELAEWFDSSSLSRLVWSISDSRVEFEKKVEREDMPARNANAPSPIGPENRDMLFDENTEIDSDAFFVRSPVVGTFYSSASPDEAPFVSVGQRVSKGDVLFIVEAMKLFNEVTSPVDGVVKRIIPENESMVEYDEKIVEIEV